MINNKKQLLSEFNKINNEIIGLYSPKKLRECVFQGCRNKPIVFKRVFNDETLPKKWHCKKHSIG